MPLQFALRPRFDLERPVRRRRPGWLRLPPLLVPIAAYWLAIAGVTHTLIRVATAEPSPARDALVSSPPIIAAPLPTAAPSSDAITIEPPDLAQPEIPEVRHDAPPLAPEEESLPIVALRDDGPRADRVQEATPRVPAPAQAARAPAPAEPRARLSRAAEPRLDQYADVALTKPADVPAPAEEAAPRAREVAKDAVERDTPRVEAPTSLPSCESAAASANQSVDLRSRRGATPDLTRDAFAAILENGAYLGQCAVPGRMALDICAAVRDGKVVGVSVTTHPRDAALSACVRRAVAGLRFPRSNQLDVTRTRFDPSL